MRTIAISVLILFAACSVYKKTEVKISPEGTFNSYKSFAWLKDVRDSTSAEYYSSVVRNNTRNFIGKKFVERGYDFDPDSPDVLLQLVIRGNRKMDEVRIIQNPKNYAGNYFYGSDYYFPYHGNYEYVKSSVYCYPEGYCVEKMEYLEESITLNVIDRNKNVLVWSATARGDIYDPGQAKRSIHPAVEAIMRKYPRRK